MRGAPVAGASLAFIANIYTRRHGREMTARLRAYGKDIAPGCVDQAIANIYTRRHGREMTARLRAYGKDIAPGCVDQAEASNTVACARGDPDAATVEKLDAAFPEAWRALGIGVTAASC